MAQLVCTLEVPAASLKAGSIVVAGGRARYLGEKAGHLLGYDQWPYVAYNDDGSVAAHGTMNVRHDAKVLTVAVHIDGGIVVA
jgi:hypothetical protein